MKDLLIAVAIGFGILIIGVVLSHSEVKQEVPCEQP
jgi:hypothetical protein